MLGLPLFSVCITNAAVRNLNFIPQTLGFTELQIKGWNMGSSDTVLILNWKAGDPAPDSIALPTSLNETFHLLILNKKPDGSRGSEEGEYSPNSGHTSIHTGALDPIRMVKPINVTYAFSANGRAIEKPEMGFSEFVLSVGNVGGFSDNK